MISRRAFMAGAATLIAAPHLSSAQEQSKTPRIAYVARGFTGDRRSQRFLEGLRDYGYVDGETITVEYYRFREFSELPQLLPRVVSSRPDVIVALQTPTALAAKDATKDIPIVIAGIGDPVAVGIVPSLGRPGGNVTGLSLNMVDNAAKRLQFMKEMIPGLARVAIVYVSDNAAHLPILARAQSSGREQLGLDVRAAGVISADELDAVIPRLAADDVQALVILPDIIFSDAPIAELALKYRLPVARYGPNAGGLFSYGASVSAQYLRLAYFVDRILKGNKPADLPIEQPTTYNFVINLKTARELGITLPNEILLRATEVIE